MKSYIIFLIKIILLLVVLLGVFYVLEFGFTIDSSDKSIKSFLLSGFTTVMVLNFKLRRFVLIFSTICLIVMAFTYILNFGDLSNTVGNFGFSLLVITVLLYFPQIIKKGRIEKF